MLPVSHPGALLLACVCVYREHLFLKLNEDTSWCCDSKNKHWEISPKAWVTHLSALRDPRSASRQALGQEAGGVGRSSEKGQEIRSKVRGTVRAVCGLEYSLIICLDFGVKA